MRLPTVSDVAGAPAALAQVVGRMLAREVKLDGLQQLIDRRYGLGTTGAVQVTQETALRHSAVWAGLRLRANLVSMLPVDTFRRVGGVQVEVPKPPFLIAPEGEDRVPASTMAGWLWATQYDLDRYGMTAGVILERDGRGHPRVVELAQAGTVKVRSVGARVTSFNIGGQEFSDPRDVWFETQYRPAGFAIGLCPIAYAAWSIGGYLSAQQFALDYFAVGGAPSGVLRNTLRAEIPAPVLNQAKERFKAATLERDIFVTGKEWEWSPAAAPEAAAAFLEEKRYGVADVARFLDVPADLIDGAVSGQSVTYANLTQRNLQLLVMSMQAAIGRREDALSLALERPRYVKLNTNAILRMDPEARARMLGQQVRDRLIAPSEARDLDNLPPFDDGQLAEFDRLFGSPNREPATKTGVPA